MIHYLRPAVKGERPIDISKAQRAVVRSVTSRRITVGSQVYVAYDAHRLLESLSDGDGTRPGHLA